jgi:hypothetical protein
MQENKAINWGIFFFAAEAGGGVEAGGVQEPQGAGVPAAGAGQDPRRDDGDLDQRLRHQRGLPVCGVGRGHLWHRQIPHAHACRDANLQPWQHVRYVWCYGVIDQAISAKDIKYYQGTRGTDVVIFFQASQRGRLGGETPGLSTRRS